MISKKKVWKCIMSILSIYIGCFFLHLKQLLENLKNDSFKVLTRFNFLPDNGMHDTFRALFLLEKTTIIVKISQVHLSHMCIIMIQINTISWQYDIDIKLHQNNIIIKIINPKGIIF